MVAHLHNGVFANSSNRKKHQMSLASVCAETTPQSEKHLKKSAGQNPFAHRKGASCYCTAMVTGSGPAASHSQAHGGDDWERCGFEGHRNPYASLLVSCIYSFQSLLKLGVPRQKNYSLRLA